jgi:nucleotide-binding universal stress UspA family protein
MNTLLVCTDFSDSAAHAARYACVVARQFRIPSIILFHAWELVPASRALPVTDREKEAQASAAMQELEALKESLAGQVDAGTSIRVRAEKLPLVDNIDRVVTEENADLIVMGISGKSKWDKLLVGSNTTKVSQKSRHPVLIVPARAALEPITSILFACDLKEVTAKTPLEPLDRVMQFFSPASLTVLNVDAANKHFTTQTPEEIHQLHHIFDKYKPEYAYIDHEDTVTAITDYAGSHAISLVIIIPHHYNFLQKLLHRPTSDKLIYNSHVPLLSIQR